MKSEREGQWDSQGKQHFKVVWKEDGGRMDGQEAGGSCEVGKLFSS